MNKHYGSFGVITLWTYVILISVGTIGGKNMLLYIHTLGTAISGKLIVFTCPSKANIYMDFKVYQMQKIFLGSMFVYGKDLGCTLCKSLDSMMIDEQQ